MLITINTLKKIIETTEVFKNLSGTDKFKQSLLLKNYKNIHNDFEQAKRLGVDYVAQYMTSSLELSLIRELVDLSKQD